MSTIVTKTISAANVFSDEVFIRKGYNFSIIDNSFSGTVTLQRRFNQTELFRDIATFVGQTEQWGMEPSAAFYRFGVKTGEYISGEVVGRIENAAT